MKKYILYLILFSNLVFSQISKKKEPFFNFEPKLKVSLIAPFNFGNNHFAKDYRNNLGFGINVSLLRIKKYSFSLGYDFKRYTSENKEIIGDFGFINASSTYFQTEYIINYNKEIQIHPFVGYSGVISNFKDEEKTTLAKQIGNEIRVGSAIDYKLNKVFSAFFSFHYAYYFNDLNASTENKKYFGKSNMVQFSVGLEIN
ncbi:hypothetical protein [Flavobacterium sp.]|uniref:hypothetical protein n=1 Tax=Flavobacterium sp. TaxID=239 RepID=UPI00261F717D|nr:hypothetical protein [Flavobacterium sp.]